MMPCRKAIGQTRLEVAGNFLRFLNQRVDKGATKRLFPTPFLPCSSVVEQVTVNHLVVGSNPTGAAIFQPFEVVS